MVRLTRLIRFSVNPAGSPRREGSGFAGKPGISGFGAHYELEVSLEGEPGMDTGYLEDIKAIDRQVREVGLAIIESAAHHDPSEPPGADPVAMMLVLFEALDEALPASLASIVFRPSPYHAIEMTSVTQASALLRMRFDFAASHRLHTASLSDEENRRLFGKCNYANGHGHNYEFLPCVEVTLDGSGGTNIMPAEIERLAQELILDRYDHRHLNLDFAEFGPDGVNPTVENIARIFFERFKPAIEAAGAVLREVEVRESDRTSATYPA